MRSYNNESTESWLIVRVFCDSCACCSINAQKPQPSPATFQSYPRSNSIIPHHSPFQYHSQRSGPVYLPQPGFRPIFLQPWQNVPFNNGSATPPMSSSPQHSFKMPLSMPLSSGSPPVLPNVERSASSSLLMPKVSLLWIGRIDNVRFGCWEKALL